MSIRPPSRPLSILLLIFSLIPLILTASPTSFCKCTCFTNSTIIPLDAPPSPRPTIPASPLFSREESLLPNPNSDGNRKEYRAKNCNDCNRQFCLDYRLPICERAKMEDVFTTCFQRDSRKDEAVVFIFIFATAGLLGWAMVKPWVGKWIESAKERRNYMPVPNRGDADT